MVFSAIIRELSVQPTKWNPAPTYLKELYTLLQGGRNPAQPSYHSHDEDTDPLAEYAKALNVLELGTGCAIVSATLFHCVPHARIIATDMEEATEIATKNLDRNRTTEEDRGDGFHGKDSTDSSYAVLDWTLPLPAKIAERKSNLILVADCTYNSDVVPALVDTLKKLVDGSPDVLIAVALKWRHVSEAVFHELMKEKGMREVDKHTERCGNFDVDATGREEEIEVYLFKGNKASEHTLEGDKDEEKEGRRKRKLSDSSAEEQAKK